MFKFDPARSVMAASLTTLGLLGGAVLAAPAAQADTVTHCVSGFNINWGGNVFLQNCSDFTDNGAPYVFQLDSLTTVFIGTPARPPSTRYDVTATCTGYTIDAEGDMMATGCSTW